MDTPAARRWSLILDEQEESGLSLSDFARSRGVRPQTLGWWRWRLKDSRAQRMTTFVPVVVEDHADIDVRVGGANIRVDDRTDLRLLKRVVEALA